MLAAVVAVASAFTTTDVRCGRLHTTTVTPLNMESESTAFLSSLSKSFKPTKDVPGESSKFLSSLTQEKKMKNSLNVGAFLDALGTMYQDFQQDIQTKVQEDIKKVTTTATSNSNAMSIRLPKSVRKHIRTLKTNNLMDEANRYFQAEMIKAQEKKRS